MAGAVLALESSLARGRQQQKPRAPIVPPAPFALCRISGTLSRKRHQGDDQRAPLLLRVELPRLRNSYARQFSLVFAFEADAL
ncbi:hypothetical protein MRX96_000696 [Rhipicephalus microplus]